MCANGKEKDLKEAYSKDCSCKHGSHMQLFVLRHAPLQDLGTGYYLYTTC